MPKNMKLTIVSAKDRIHAEGYLLLWVSESGSESIDSWKVYKTKKAAQHEIDARNEPKSFIIFSSHRSRGNAMLAIKWDGLPMPQAYYSWSRDTGKGVYLLDQEQVYAIRGLLGWRRLRGPFDDLMKCWG